LLELKKPTYFHFLALKTDNLLFCHQDIPSIHNGCFSNPEDYAKKNNVLPTILSTELGAVIIDFSTEHNLTSIYH